MRTQDMRWAGAVAAMVLAPSALAHTGYGSGFGDGFVHPITGLDHLLAIAASGLLAVRIGRPWALLAVPLAFVAAMVLGAGAATLGIPMPRVEWAISASVIVLGAVAGLAPRVTPGMAIGIVGVGAFFHGHAHGTELAGLSLGATLFGMALGTLLLHATAVGLGLAAVKTQRPWLLRAGGVSIATAFVLILLTSR